MSDDRMNGNTDLQQEKFIRNHKNYVAENIEIESSSSQKKDHISKIINNNDIEYKSMCEDNDHQDYNNNYLSMTKQKRDKIADGCQHQSKKNCMTRIINGQIVDSHYGIIYISHVYIA